MLVYLNGECIDAEQAGVSLWDIGLLRGYGVFEVVRTFEHRPFLLGEHLQRLRRSAQFMNLVVPVEDDDIHTAVEHLIEQNVPGSSSSEASAKEGQIRIMLTGGPTADGITYDADTPTFAILVTPFHPLPDSLFSDGVGLMTVEHQRQTPKIKTLDYALAVRLQPTVQEHGAFELLYTHDGAVLEATTSNVFIVKDGVVVTPKEGVLLGTTRNYVIDLLQGEGTVVEERRVTLGEMWDADEMFLTATNKDVVPVVRVDDRVIADGKPGPLTCRTMELFYESVELWITKTGTL